MIKGLKHKCILDECNKEISIFRDFCSKDCRDKFLKKYPDIEKDK